MVSSELITLKEIAKMYGVPRARIKDYFKRGKPLEFVPRPTDPKAPWRIYRKDFEKAVERKERQLAQEDLEKALRRKERQLAQENRERKNGF